jgi:hypothetical protein
MRHALGNRNAGECSWTRHGDRLDQIVWQTGGHKGNSWQVTQILRGRTNLTFGIAEEDGKTSRWIGDRKPSILLGGIDDEFFRRLPRFEARQIIAIGFRRPRSSRH